MKIEDRDLSAATLNVAVFFVSILENAVFILENAANICINTV